MFRRVRRAGLRFLAVLTVASLALGGVSTAVAAEAGASRGAGPIPPPDIASDRFPEFDPADSQGSWIEGVGEYADFTFSSDDPRVVRYRYGVNNSPHPDNNVPTTDGAARTVSLFTEEPGLRFVTAQAFDETGRSSAPRTFLYLAGPAPEQVGFAFDEPSGAEDTRPAAPERNLRLRGGHGLGTPAALGTGLTLDGVTGHVTTEGAVVDSARPWTVSAWARLENRPDHDAVVVEQLGTGFVGYSLHYAAEERAWAATADRGATSAAGRSRVVSEDEAAVGTWTHLLLSYDGARMRLFVDGLETAETDHAPTAVANRSLLLGASGRDGAAADHFPGDLDHLQFFDHGLRTADGAVQALAAKQPVNRAPHRPPVAVLPLDEAADSPTVATVSGHAPAVHRGAVASGVDGYDGRAVRYDGRTGRTVAAAPAVDTAGTFSVSAWVRLDKATATGDGVVVSQSGEHGAGLTLEYSRELDRWQFGRATADSPAAEEAYATQPARFVARDGAWVHLAGVRDAVAGTLRLYVDGAAVAETRHDSAWSATGPLVIGAGTADGPTDTHFAGEIDELRLHNRVLTAGEVAAAARRDHVLAARWELDGGTDTTPDASRPDNPLTLHGGTAFGEGRIGDGALVLDGRTGYARTDRVPVDTSADYTVAAWARADEVPEEPVAVISIGGRSAAALTVRFVPDPDEPGWGAWQVDVGGEDVPGTSPARAENQVFYDVREWNHLAVVLDASTQRLSLYVNGSLEEVRCDAEWDGDDCVPRASWQDVGPLFAAVGPLEVGRERLSSDTWGGYWPGAVDDVWVYQGALRAEEITSLGFGIGP
ncbi:LamG domain-containing protein [Streptomyces lonarensis]|uniref:LamG domain-containing protein n=1 Tax=Streptomyces lonarensis TaxID=700599 RepID=A0A7X6D323_9ACTN|nr:LamG domain-containing protein [Streptomyces lonarensis]NJQ07088.1 LamG domain-containing protein [Streptomyces lonarensis]